MPFLRFNRKLIGVLMVGTAAICLLASAGWSIYSYHLTTTALRATGHITQMAERHDDRGDYWYPVYAFTDRDGVPHTVYSSVGSAPPRYSVGDPVTVLYYAGAGNDAHLDDWLTLWGAPLILLALAVVDLATGIGVLLWPWFARQPQVGTDG